MLTGTYVKCFLYLWGLRSLLIVLSRYVIIVVAFYIRPNLTENGIALGP